MLPKRKVIVRATLILKVVCRFQKMGMGMPRRITSVKMLGKLPQTYRAVLSMQCSFCWAGVPQFVQKGRHAARLAIQVAMAPLMVMLTVSQRAMWTVRYGDGNRRRYITQIANLPMFAVRQYHAELATVYLLLMLTVSGLVFSR